MDLSSCLEASAAHSQFTVPYNDVLTHPDAIGALRQTVHSILSKLPWVASFALAHEQRGGWGATIVQLRPAIKSD
jgi:hypothetical protein